MVGISNTKAPFILATEDELSVLIDESDSVNTKKQISYAVKRIKTLLQAPVTYRNNDLTSCQ